MRRDRQKIVRRGWLIIGGAAALSVLLTLLVFACLGSFDDRAATEEGGAGVKAVPALGRVVSRKNIYDHNYRELAVSFRLTSIYARPLELVDIDAAVKDIATVLEVDKDELRSLLKAERSFIWLGRQLPALQAEKILGLGIPGVYGVDEMHRFYPHKQVAASVLGFVKDDQGLAGIEFQYDNVLRGIVGKDADLAKVGLSSPDSVEERGADLILSLDLRLQSLLEKRLGRVMQKANAASGVAAVMDAKTGAVVAMVSLPTYDPNSFWDFTATDRRNRAVVDPVFPGGIGRLFRCAAAYELRGGFPAIGVDESAAQWQQDSEGVFVSRNLARLGKDVSGDAGDASFVERLALHPGTGIDLPVEQGGVNEQWFAGEEQTGSTTAIDLLTAFARTVNGGVLVRPRLLSRIRWEGGEWSGAAVSKDGAANFRPGLCGALLDSLGGGSGHGRELIVESRLPEQLVESRAAVQGKELAGVVEMASPAVVAAETSRNAERYYATMLGMSAGNGPKLVVVAALSGSRFDAKVSSPLAGLGREILRKAVALRRGGSIRPQTLPQANEEAFYQAWLKIQKQPDRQQRSVRSRKVEVMPTVTGLSLRKALQVLQAYGLPVRVQGSGRVVAQQPVLGASLKGAQEVVLSLQLEQ